MSDNVSRWKPGAFTRYLILLPALVVAVSLGFTGAASAQTAFQAGVKSTQPKPEGPCSNGAFYCGTAHIAGYGAASWNFFLTGVTMRIFRFNFKHKRMTLLVTAAGIIVGLYAFNFLGTEFLPELNEGSIWVRATLAPSAGPTESLRVMNEARLKLTAFPTLLTVVTQPGRPDDDSLRRAVAARRPAHAARPDSGTGKRR